MGSCLLRNETASEHPQRQAQAEGNRRIAIRRVRLNMCECFVLFCFVWLATLGVPVVAPGTAAGPFRRVVEAPFSVPSSPVVERGALSTEVPPHLR